MNLKKRDCKIKMRLVPYGGGWTDVYIDFGDGEHYFIISSVDSSFGDLLSALYHLYPENNNYEDAGNMIEYKSGICEWINDDYVVKRIVGNTKDETLGHVIQPIPWKASFEWDEEGSYSSWVLEREANINTSFDIKVTVDIHRKEPKQLEYVVPYADLCYAVADACTKALKKHGFLGYYTATYTEDMNVRYLLFLKAAALGNMEALKLTYYEEQGQGETSDFGKEMELLLFDMSQG